MNKSVLNVLIGTSFFALFSCQPKDVTLNTKGNNSGVNQQSVSSMAGSDFDKLLALSIDRQVEALHVIKAVLNDKYADAHGMQLLTDASDPTNMTLTTKADSSKLETDTRSYEYHVNYQIEKMFKDTDGKLIYMILKNIPQASSKTVGNIKQGTKLTDFTVYPMSEYITIKTKSAKTNEYLVSVDRIDEANSKADNKSVIDMEMSASIQWDGHVETLDSALPVKMLTLSVDRKGNKLGNLKYEKIDSDLSVNLGACVSISGKMLMSKKIETKGDGKMTQASVKIVDSPVVITDSTIEVEYNGKKSLSQAQECAVRPVVDLTRML